MKAMMMITIIMMMTVMAVMINDGSGDGDNYSDDDCDNKVSTILYLLLEKVQPVKVSSSSSPVLATRSPTRYACDQTTYAI